MPQTWEQKQAKQLRDEMEEEIDKKGDVLEQVKDEMRQMLDREPSGVVEGAPHFQVLQNGKMVDVSQPNRYRGIKRTISEKERDIVDVAHWYLLGMNHQQIADKLNAERPYSIKRAEVSAMIHRMYQRWQESYLSDINRLKVRELAKVDLLEQEYWRAWEESKKEKSGVEQVKTEDKMPASKGDMHTSYARTKTTIKKEKRDPNVVYLQGIQWCIEQRCKIFGLNAPATVNINWRKQAEEAGITNPDEIVGSLADEFVRYAEEGRAALPPVAGSS